MVIIGLDNKITLDGSDSYDPDLVDRGDNTGIQYYWTCVCEGLTMDAGVVDFAAPPSKYFTSL